ncbi:hypothetical protein KAT82_07765, partial [bacterium]|nr:hypothetical protein [bacterium]
PDTLATAGATTALVPPLAAVGEQIGALSDPLITFADEFVTFFASEGPAILNDWMGIAAQAFDGMEKMHGGFGKAIKAASMGFLKDSLKMLIRAKAVELAGISITEKGKVMMTGQWWRLPLIAAGYGLAMSGLNQMKSFDESAVITRGGSLSGNVSIGDVIVSPDALKNFMKGGGGGRSVQVSVTFNGSYMGDSAGFRDDIDYLVERVALEMER